MLSASQQLTTCDHNRLQSRLYTIVAHLEESQDTIFKYGHAHGTTIPAWYRLEAQ